MWPQFLRRNSPSTRKTIAFLAAIGLLVCVANPIGQAAARTLRIAIEGDALTLDPHAYLYTLSQSLQGAIYEPLVRIGAGFQVEPVLAERATRVDATT